MLCLLSKNQLHSFTPQLKLVFLHLKSLSTISEHSVNSTSLTRDYLINSCGISPESALSLAQKVCLTSIENPNKVVALFQTNGFSKSHITQIISKHPLLLNSIPDKNLKPKIIFLQNLGFSGPRLTNLITCFPQLLRSSLKNHFIPNVEFLKSYLSTDHNVCASITRSPFIFGEKLEKVMGPNISILRNMGVPDSSISKLLLYHPRSLLKQSDLFHETVNVVREMGFDPSSTMFVHAVRIIIEMSKGSWERKLAVYNGLGWSKEEILLMFKKQPTLMCSSEKKIMRATDYFLNTLNFTKMQIISNPVLLLYSMDKRIVPRCAVLGVLYSKGVSMRLSVMQALAKNESQFMEKYVVKFQETVPDVVKAYEGKIAFKGFAKVGVV